MSSTNHNETNEGPARDAQLPERIAGRYRVKSLLGRGGFGAVFEAYDELDDRPVALKVIRKDANVEPPSTRSQDIGSSSSASVFGHARKSATHSFGSKSSPYGDDVVHAFKEEFRLLTQLHHPNLAQVFDFGRCDELGALYFTQELVIGQYLTEYFKGKPREAIVEIFVQLARALDYLHALGLLHEDIKPSNVLVCPPESPDAPPRAKLIDFGLARVLRRPGRSKRDDNEEPEGIMVLGTPGFSAPEKVRGQATDPRSDIYSLAATMYAAVRAQRPFAAKNFREALRAQLDWRPELAGVLLTSCGAVVAELVGRMLAPDPDLRPQSARSIVLELLRREPGSARDRSDGDGDRDRDRREFARVLVEHLPFVDRSHYLDLLLAKAAEVFGKDAGAGESSRSSMRNHSARTLVVEAPEGMGKQRLLSELRREIQLGGGLFVEGSCWSNDHSALGPFGPIVTQLATALGERVAPVSNHSELVRLARERAAGDAAAGTLMEFLIACAAERPYVIHLSDLAHGHEFARTTFEQLARALDHNGAPILLCATSVPHQKVVGTLAALARDRVAEIWHLRPFSQREMYLVLQGILGEMSMLRDLVTMLDKLTGGHPLSFRETLRVLIEEGILTRDSSSWVLRGASAATEELHQTLAQRSEVRLDGLGVSAWEVTSILYLLEAPIDEDRLAELSDLRKERFRRTLDRLEGEGLVLRSAASGSSKVMLAHESVREAVRRRYADSLNETRLDLAARIEELHIHDVDLVYLRARLVDDAAESLESIDLLEQVAMELFNAGQPRLGAQLCDRLIHRLRKHGRTQTMPRLLNALVMLLKHGSGALEHSRREANHYESGVLVAQLLENHTAEALFWLGLADRLSTVNNSEDMEFTLERLSHGAEAASLANDRVLQLRIANRRTEVLLGAGEVEQADRYSREAMEIIDLPDAQAVDKCHIMGVRLRCLAVTGQIREATKLHDMAKPIAATVPVAQRQSYLSGITYLASFSNDPDLAIPELELAIEQLRAANTPRLVLLPMHNLADLRLHKGDLERAAETFREVIRLSTLYGYAFPVHFNRGFLGYTLARLGSHEEGAAMLTDARNALERLRVEQSALDQIRLLDAEVAHLMGQSARARRELEEMLADFHSTHEVSLAQWAQDALARIEHDLGTNFIETPDQSAVSDYGNPDEDTVRTRPVR